MRTVVVTGSGGLVGSEAVHYYARRAAKVVGIDNDMRAAFFGDEASTSWQSELLASTYENFQPVTADIRDRDLIDRLFAEFGGSIDLVIHAAAQPSHDWAARDPHTDFSVNATGTLVLLEATRRHCPEAVFVFTSTNKVYGDGPNSLPLVEHDQRWEIAEDHPFHAEGIDESMSIDSTLHSLFGASKVAADILVQEYGRYFGMPTGVFRGGCLTGPGHSGTVLHGFLAYLMKCTVTDTAYRVFGHSAKQVRDNIHSTDLIAAFDAFAREPRAGAVYNMGGGRFANCSMLEAIALCEEIAGRPLHWEYDETARIGDHRWWISDVTRFRADYPQWQPTMDISKTLQSIHDDGVKRWRD
ncbi:MAG: NAD-dependent epimerase/dehydratase family protein [Nitriliruptorales bacterium]|nr:NAD-dependent epimerase/dehydratase family protein [Nitriliruptorales bacterium]